MGIKKSCTTKIIIVLSFLIFQLIPSQLESQNPNNFISFGQNLRNSPDHPTLPKLSFHEKGYDYVELEYTFPGATISEHIVNNVVYNLLHIEGFSLMKQVGRPALPSHIDIIGAPQNATLKVKIIEADYKDIQSFMIHPALEPATDRYGDPEPQFTIDQRIYSTNNYFPKDIVQIVDQQMVRGIPIAFSQIIPVQFNPVTLTIRVYSRIKYRIEFIGTDLSFKSFSQNNSFHFTKTFKNYILNNSIIPEGKSSFQTRSDSKNYIIVTHSNYDQTADSLKKWKEQMGYSVEIISRSSWTSSQIKDSIHSRYQNWSPHPDYFVLIGDHDLVPGEIHQSPTNDDFATDLYYACMDGPSDFIADMAFGRISVSSASQALTVVQKIINYERNPVNNASFYNTGLNCAQFQDESPKDGYADRRFSQTTEEVINYVSGTLGYTVNRVYKTEPSVNPTNWNNGYYANGEPLPQTLLKPGFAWDGDATDIENGINSGAFYVLHRDHGYVGGSGWHRPYFVKSNIDNLTNGDMLPVVFSINCHTGEFQLSECFAEKFLRKTNGGAAGVIAAAYYSYSGLNDALTLGLFDAIWSNPGLIPNFTGYGGISNPSLMPHSDIFTMGDVMNQGLIRMAETWAQDIYTHELFHYFGDPSMKIWTAQPVQIIANHIDTIPCGSTSLSISGCNCTDAIATLYYNGKIIGDTQLSAGSGTIIFDTVNNPLLSSTLTISEHNFIPYIVDLPTGSCDIPPVADFVASDTNAIICGSYHSVVTFTDLSINNPTYWVWLFSPSTVTFLNGTNANSRNPQVVFDSPGSYTVSLNAQNAFGGDIEIKNDYINVIEANGLSLPFTEDFESGGFITNDWTTENPDGNITWEVYNPVSGNPPGMHSAYITLYNYGSIGAKDAMITPELNFSGHSSIILNFKHAYTRKYSFATDSLNIYITTDCGNTWEKVVSFGENGTGSFATAPDQSYRSSSQFFPSTADDWCDSGVGPSCNYINLSPWAGNKSVKIKFESVCRFGNNLFIDDINIDGSNIAISANFTSNKTSICVGESIDFTDLSNGNPNSWTWFFPGATPSSSTLENPSGITYNSPGSYDVKLLISNLGDSDSLTKQSYITVFPEPAITLSPDTAICENSCVTLTASGGTAYLWNTGQASYEITVCPSATSSYTVTITDINGCTNSNDVTITVNPDPIAFAGSNQQICEGECANLQAFGGGIYNWSSGDNTKSITVCPSSTTTYIVTVTNNYGCTDSDDVMVSVHPLPTANAGVNVSIPQGHCTNLNASGGVSYLWNTGASAALINVCPANTTTYTVTVTDNSGCTDSDDVIVTVQPVIVTSIEPLPNNYCPGDTVIVQVSTTNVYNVGGISLVLNYDSSVITYIGYNVHPALLNTFHYINNTGTQVRMMSTSMFPLNIGNGILLEYAFIFNGGSCDLSWNIQVPNDCEYNDVNTIPLPSTFYNGNVNGSGSTNVSAGGDKDICGGGTCTLLVGSGGVSYYWNTGETSSNIVVCPNITETYTVTATDINGCTASDEATVNINQLPSANAGVDQTICDDECTTLTGAGGNDYQWSNGGSTSSIIVCPPNNTNYILTVTDINGCTASDEVSIDIIPKPQASAGVDKTITIGSCASLTASGGISYLWNTGETTQVINVCPTITTYYTTTVTASNGCTDTDDVLVTVTTQPVIETSVPHIEANPGDHIIVPVHVSNVFGVASISLTLDYDNTVLSYVNYQNINPVFYGSYYTLNSFQSSIIFGWFGFAPVSITDGILFEIEFIYNGDSCGLVWDIMSGSCQYSDNNFNLLPANFVNGSVKPLPGGIQVSTKTFLQGPYSGNGSMSTGLQSYIPLVQPYNNMPWNYTGTEFIGSVPANMVDWILVELRDSSDGTTVIARRAAILLSNGMIVDTNSSNVVNFQGLTEGYYYITLHHRNHMPVMSETALAIPNTTAYDFTDADNFPPFGGKAQALTELETGIYGMVTGDVNGDDNLKYSGPGNDRGLILQKIITISGSTGITTTIDGYYSEDLNMDGIVKYSGPGNDQSIIIQTLVNLTGSTSITTVYITPVP